jgi:hypothetical protein
MKFIWVHNIGTVKLYLFTFGVLFSFLPTVETSDSTELLLPILNYTEYFLRSNVSAIYEEISENLLQCEEKTQAGFTQIEFCCTDKILFSLDNLCINFHSW